MDLRSGLLIVTLFTAVCMSIAGLTANLMPSQRILRVGKYVIGHISNRTQMAVVTLTFIFMILTLVLGVVTAVVFLAVPSYMKYIP